MDTIILLLCVVMCIVSFLLGRDLGFKQAIDEFVKALNDDMMEK